MIHDRPVVDSLVSLNIIHGLSRVADDSDSVGIEGGDRGMVGIEGSGRSVSEIGECSPI